MKIDKNKMISWQSFKDGKYEYYLEYTMVKTPMWIYKLFSKLARFFEKLKWATTESWEADWETRKSKKKDWEL